MYNKSIFIYEGFYNSSEIYDFLRNKFTNVVISKVLFDIYYDAYLVPQSFVISNLDYFQSIKSNILIQLVGSGHEKLNSIHFPQGVRILNSSSVYALPISEYIISFILNHFKSTSNLVELSRNRIWKKDVKIRDIAGLNAVIIGSGSIATKLTSLLLTFDISTTVIARTPMNYKHRFPAEINVRDFGYLRELREEIDILIVAVPLNKDSFNLIDSKLMTIMKDDSLLISISREQVINLRDINEISQVKQISIIMDSFDEEPIVDLSYYKNNRIITPHCSWYSKKNANRLAILFEQNLVDFF